MMHVPTPVLAAIGVAFLVLVFVLLRRSRGRDLMAPPRPVESSAARGAPPAASVLPPDLEREVRALLRQGNKIEAIKRVREETHMGLGEAKTLVESL